MGFGRVAFGGSADNLRDSENPVPQRDWETVKGKGKAGRVAYGDSTPNPEPNRKTRFEHRNRFQALDVENDNITYTADPDGIVIKKPTMKATLEDYATATREKRRTPKTASSRTQRTSTQRFEM